MKAAAADDIVPVVEFYHATLDHYFITAATQEIADLDAGIHPGWRRTGLSFNAHASSTPGTGPVCRFYVPPALGDSHFYSASADECAQTHSRFPDFVAESPAVFHIALPDLETGACPASAVPVYRLWDRRADTNHRYTGDRVAWQHMRDLGWVAEGYGSEQVIMCSPATPAISAVDLAATGRSIIKARAAGNVVAVLEERLTSIFEQGPDRVLALLQADGRSARIYTPPSGWSLVDMAIHSSGEVSLALTTDRAVRIVRLDREGVVRSDQPFVDPASATDPFFDFDASVKNDDSLQPVLMHDAARVVPLGESLALVLRTGRNAVVAYRLDLSGDGGYVRTWRTLVEPGTSIDGVFLSSGSFDAFGQLANHVGVRVDVDSGGTIAIGVVEQPFLSYPFEAHAIVFRRADHRAGRHARHAHLRRGRAPHGQHGHRHAPARRAVWLACDGRWIRAGRSRSLAGASRRQRLDAFAARVGSDGTARSYRVVDVDRGDALFDVTALPSGRLLALGTTGYVQNPSGASISEDTQPLLIVLDADGSPTQRVSLPDGPRQDQLLTVTSLNGRPLIGGMRNGPGTHSGDSQRERHRGGRLPGRDGRFADAVTSWFRRHSSIDR